jgi:glyoxylase-like metal-dependent hydrolase (beta-lactamase superfamily II)
MARRIPYLCASGLPALPIPKPIDMQVHSFTFSPFLENTYVLADQTGECVIVDPGCYGASEQSQLRDYIREQGLRPVRLLLTHAHLDHIFGNQYVYDTFGLRPELPEAEVTVLEAMPEYAAMFGVEATPSPAPGGYLTPGATTGFGTTELEIISAPGHSPGHVVLYHRASQTLIGGDVLFLGSIGRIDLPGGDEATMMQTLREVILPLPDDVTVYPGHGPSTTIGQERRSNPFLLQLQ